MILLSRIIKSSWTNSEKTSKKTIHIIPLKKIDSQSEEVQETVPSYEEIEAIYQKAQSEAEIIIINARNNAEAIMQQVEVAKNQWFEVERIKAEEEAKQIGYDEGFNVGKKQGYDEQQEKLEMAKQVVELAKKDYQHYIQSSEHTILELALRVSEKIINQELESNNEAFVQLVIGAIKEAREYQEVQLRVHPTQYETVLSYKEELLSIFPKETEFFIFPDDNLTPTSCMIETPSGRIDASIDSQMYEVKEKLFELLEGE